MRGACLIESCLASDIILECPIVNERTNASRNSGANSCAMAVCTASESIGRSSPVFSNVECNQLFTKIYTTKACHKMTK